MTKKILSLILCVALILPTFVMSVGAQKVLSSTVVLHQDFEDASNTAFTTHTEGSTESAAAMIKKVEDGNTYLNLQEKAYFGYPWFSAASGPANHINVDDNFVFQFDMRMNTRAKNFGVEVYASDATSSARKGYRFRDFDNIKSTSIPTGIELDKWYTFKLVVINGQCYVYRADRGSNNWIVPHNVSAKVDSGLLTNTKGRIAFCSNTMFQGGMTSGDYDFDNLMIATGTTMCDVSFTPSGSSTKITSIDTVSGSIKADFDFVNMDGVSKDATAVVVAYDSTGKPLKVETSDVTIPTGVSTVSSDAFDTTGLSLSGGRLEAYLRTDEGTVDDAYGILGEADEVASSERLTTGIGTIANVINVEGKRNSKGAVIIEIEGKTTGNLIAAAQFITTPDGSFKKAFPINGDLCTGDTEATITVWGTGSTAETFDVSLEAVTLSNWDAMVAAFAAMTDETDVQTFYTTYDNNLNYYEVGNPVMIDGITVDLTGKYETLAFIKSNKTYPASMTIAETVNAAIELVDMLPEVETFENAFAAAKAEATDEEKLAAMKALLEGATVVEFSKFNSLNEEVANFDAVCREMLATGDDVDTLIEIFNTYETKRDAQITAEKALGIAFRSISDGASFEAFIENNKDTLGITDESIASYDGYWDVMYDVYVAQSYSSCADSQIMTAITYINNYVAEFKLFISDLNTAAVTKKKWEDIKTVLNATYTYITVALADASGVVNEEYLYKRLTGNVNFTTIAEVTAAFSAAVTAQLAAEDAVKVEFNALTADKVVLKTFLTNNAEIMMIPALANYSDDDMDVFVEVFNKFYVGGTANFAAAQTELTSLVVCFGTAKALISSIVAESSWSAVRDLYTGADGVLYIDGLVTVTVTDPRTFYTRIINKIDEEDRDVKTLADLTTVFNEAHAEQLLWEANQGAYGTTDDARLYFDDTAWVLDRRGNVIRLKGKVENVGKYQLIIRVSDGADTPDPADDHAIYIRQIQTTGRGEFDVSIGLNPGIVNYHDNTTAKLTITGEGVNSYSFSPFELYSDAELNGAVTDFMAIKSSSDAEASASDKAAAKAATKAAIKTFFDNNSAMFEFTGENAVNTASDKVIDALYVAFTTDNKAGKYTVVEDSFDIINGVAEDTGALVLIETMKEIITCLDALTAAANEMVGETMGRPGKIKAQVTLAQSKGWISPSVTGTVSVTDEEDMYLELAGKTFNYMSTVEDEYETAYALYATTGTTPAPGPGSSPSPGPGGGGGGGGGGGKAPNKVEITIGNETVDNGTAVINGQDNPVAPFTDITSEFSWAQSSIDGLRRYGIIRGDGNGKYRPGSSISREEFLSILLKTFKIDTKKTNANFNDVNKNEWYYDTVSTAYEMGIVKGYPDGSFGIGDMISRADMAVMICRALNSINKQLETKETSIIFQDASEIPDYAYDAITSLQTAGILNGDTYGLYNPANDVTRAESAVAFWSIFTQISGIVLY